MASKLIAIESKVRVVLKSSLLPSTTTTSCKTAVENGCYHRISHTSSSTGTKMIFGLFLPSKYDPSKSSNPIMFWLSGLTCDDTNFAIKAGSKAFETAEEEGIAIVMPDTSPRHDDAVPNVDSYDMGIGAGFYINATEAPYNKHYHMYDYVTKELPQLLEEQFNLGANGLKSISGHSMGGHGALTIALKEGQSSWASVSAFAPICNPTNCPWGMKAFPAYLGSVDAGKAHDATCLLSQFKNTPPPFENILIDQGTSDQFLEEQLKPESILAAAKNCEQKIELRFRAGFDHSYFFIAAFISSHVQFHAKALSKRTTH